MENFRAGAEAVTAGVMLVIVLYISYIAIPLIILCTVVFGIYWVRSVKTDVEISTTSSSDKIKIVW